MRIAYRSAVIVPVLLCMVLVLAGCDLFMLLSPAAWQSTVPQAGDQHFRSIDGMVMVYVPAGEFAMGVSANPPPTV